VRLKLTDAAVYKYSKSSKGDVVENFIRLNIILCQICDNE